MKSTKLKSTCAFRKLYLFAVMASRALYHEFTDELHFLEAEPFIHEESPPLCSDL